MAGNLVKCTYMQKTKMMHIYRNNFLNGLHVPNLIVQHKIISLSYFFKIHDTIKTDLCTEKNYLNKSVTYRIQIYYQLYFLGEISILSDVHFQILSTQNRQNTLGSTSTWNKCHDNPLLDLHSWRSNFIYSST